MYYYKLKSSNEDDLQTLFNDGMRQLLEKSFIYETDNELYLDGGDETSIVFYNGWLIRPSDIIRVDSSGAPYWGEATTLKEEEKQTDGSTWSDEVNIKYSLSEHLCEQLRSRYAFIDRPKRGLSNVVMDTYLPRYLYKHKLKTNIYELENIPSTAVSISPFTAKVLGTKQMELEQMIKILGYQRKDIKRLMLAVKARNLNLVFVGAGGGGINKAYWLSSLARMVNLTSLFKKIYVFDEDDAEISNLFRFPIDPSTIDSDNISKLSIIKPYVLHLSKEAPELYSKFLAKNNNNNYSYPHEIFYKKHKANIHSPFMDHIYKTRDNFVLLGGPDLETRQKLSSCGSYIASSHSSNSCSIYLNPTQDLSVQIESYGMIQLSPFFMNQLRASIELLNILSNNDLDLKEIDKELFNYTFDGVSKMTTDRNYNFIIQDQSNMLTENESINF